METITKFKETFQAIRAKAKELAAYQKERRLQKLQKDYKTAAELTVLYRLHRKIRNKPYEEIHRFNEHTRWYAKSFTEKYHTLWDLSD